MERYVKELLRAGTVAMTMVAANGALRTLPSCVKRKNVQMERIVVAVLTVLMLVAQDYVVHLQHRIYFFISIKHLILGSRHFSYLAHIQRTHQRLLSS